MPRHVHTTARALDYLSQVRRKANKMHQMSQLTQSQPMHDATLHACAALNSRPLLKPMPASQVAGEKWLLHMEPNDGWGQSWINAAIAAVVVFAVLAAFLLSWVLISR